MTAMQLLVNAGLAEPQHRDRAAGDVRPDGYGLLRSKGDLRELAE